MRAQITKYLSAVRASYWFVPSLMAFGAVTLSVITIGIDALVGVDWPEHVPGLYSNQPDGARGLLATVAGSMITVAGVTFSLTLLAVSHSTGQFGPRLLTNFMRDRGNQITLGTFIATFLYCLLVLRTVRSAEEQVGDDSIGELGEAFVPHISILCALMLTLASVGVLIYFIHHVPESIRISHVLGDVGRELLRKCESTFPQKLGAHAASQTTGAAPTHAQLPDHFEELAKIVNHKVNGYIQAIDQSGLMATAEQFDLVVRVYSQPGDFVSRGVPMLAVSPAERADQAIDDLHAAFAYGGHRTATDNPRFLVDQLVEVAMRALSPGVNDPLTAFNCVDWLQCCLIQLADREPESGYRFDSENKLRFVATPVGYADFAASIFDQLRPYFAADRNAALYMMKMIRTVARNTDLHQRQKVLKEHADLLLAAAEHGEMFEPDLEELRTIHDNITRSCGAD